MSEQTIKCPICGRPYKVYSHTVADQSACPKCVAEAESFTRPYFPVPRQDQKVSMIPGPYGYTDEYKGEVK